MSDVILKIENLSKQYRLGNVGTGSLAHDLNRTWHSMRGKEDPYLQVGAVNDRSATASSDYVWALQDINFEVKRGEILGVIGKNGAGKSTLLKILSRVTSPTTGSIKVGGRMASLLEVGTGMHPELTGRENIFLNGAILGMTKSEISSKIDEIVEFSGCQMYIDTPVKRYSSGMRVRLGFAVAAFLEPDILVVDEVLAVGDSEFQKKAIGKMQDISNVGGRTVLFVSHNMSTIRKLCNRIVLLDNGGVLFEGNVDEGIKMYLDGDEAGSLYEAPLDKFNLPEYISLVKVVDEKFDQKNDFMFSDQICLLVRVKLANTGAENSIAFRLEDSKLRSLFTSQNSVFSDFKGEKTFLIKLPRNLLAPNDYYIHLGYSQIPSESLDVVANAVSFSIHDTHNELRKSVSKDSGCIVINCNWDEK